MRRSALLLVGLAALALSGVEYPRGDFSAKSHGNQAEAPSLPGHSKASGVKTIRVEPSDRPRTIYSKCGKMQGSITFGSQVYIVTLDPASR